MNTGNARYYVGVDPSTTSTGISVIVCKNGEVVKKVTKVKPPSGIDIFQRMVIIRDFVQLFIETALSDVGSLWSSQDCGGCCIEGSSHRSTGKHDELGQMRGILKILLHDEHQDAIEIAPARLKKFAGSGAASKDTVIKKAREMGWFIPDGEDDMADSSILAEIAYATENNREQKLTRKQYEVLADLHVTL